VERLRLTLKRYPRLHGALRGPYRAISGGLRRARRGPGTAARRIRRAWIALSRPVRERRDVRAWERNGRPAPPPPLVKRRIVAAYARRFGTRNLVETGTYRGDMVAAQRRRFGRIWSIELQEQLAERARARFARDPHVTILYGDSAALLPIILATMREPCLFWLDAHYSAGITARGAMDTPVAAEIDAILRHPVAGHVVLVDDARDFTGANDYPTIAALTAAITQQRPDWTVEVRDDVIRAHARA